MSDPFRIYIGWDSAQVDAYEVCAHSLARHASIPLDIRPLRLDRLREAGLYRRDADPLASTEFTYSRFLVPALAGYAGHALFCDCDFLWTADVAGLVALADGSMAVQCVKHDYRPAETTKLHERAQTVYPRKNWSSLMLFNCAHAASMSLTPDAVNTRDGRYLQRLLWAPDHAIGALPGEWNWLEGWDTPPDGPPPKAIHFTRGGPWFEEWRGVAYAELWLEEMELMRRRGRVGPDGSGSARAASAPPRTPSPKAALSCE